MTLFFSLGYRKHTANKKPPLVNQETALVITSGHLDTGAIVSQGFQLTPHERNTMQPVRSMKRGIKGLSPTARAQSKS